MIFVTVGTNYNDQLVRFIDDLALSLNEPIIIQTGIYGKYQPKNCEFFKMAPSLEDYFHKASLVISSGGVGTTFELLRKGVRFISISNPDIPDQHQNELLEKLSNEGYILWCKELKDLANLMNESKEWSGKKYIPPHCFQHEVIMSAILENESI